MPRQIELNNKLHHHAAVGIVIDNQQRILISKRPAHKLKGGYWEFPGGKVELNESPEQALVRELQEEVGLKVLTYSKLTQYYHDYSEHSALLDVFVITDFKGIAQSLEGQEIQWINKNEFSNFKFLEANIEIIDTFKNNYLT